MNAKGVDVSHWQSLSDWSTTGLSFVIVKASEGTTRDSMYAKHVAKGRAAGLVVGAYAFNRGDVSIQAQVEFFADTSKDADLWFIDVEGQYAFTIAQTKEFISTFKSYTGKHIGLYHSASGFFDAGQDYDWVAHWGVSQPYRSWTFHQYRGAPLDLNQFNGTEDDLYLFVELLNLGASPMPPMYLYIPGYIATVSAGANVRSAPSLSASVLRTTTKEESWTVVGWASGDLVSGSNNWLVRWANSRWEYTHSMNVPSAPVPPKPTESDCKVYSDAAYEQGAASRQPEVDALNTEASGYLNTISLLEEQNESLALESSQQKVIISEQQDSIESLTNRAVEAEALAAERDRAIDSALAAVETDPTVKAHIILVGAR